MTTTTTAIAALAVLVLLALALSLKIITQYERGHRLQAGAPATCLRARPAPGRPLPRAPGTGRHPSGDSDHPASGVITEDNVPARVNAVVLFNVTDPVKAVMAVENYAIAPPRSHRPR